MKFVSVPNFSTKFRNSKLEFPMYLSPFTAQDSLNGDFNYESPHDEAESRARTERLALQQLDKAKVKECFLWPPKF